MSATFGSGAVGGGGGSRGVSGVKSTIFTVKMGEPVTGVTVGPGEGRLVGLGVGKMKPVSTLRLVGDSDVGRTPFSKAGSGVGDPSGKPQPICSPAIWAAPPVSSAGFGVGMPGG